jgi:S-adenosylmethionine:tRNA ribosyltransferase-isomerase
MSPLTPADFGYPLPEHLIAHVPHSRRDGCCLLVFKRQSGQWSNHVFSDLPEILSKTAQKFLIVLNDTKVIPARLFGQKNSGGQVEILLVRPYFSRTTTQSWEVLAKPGLKVGQIVNFKPSGVSATCQAVTNYTRTLNFHCSPSVFHALIQKTGHTPIPPYIKSPLTEPQLRQAYQTVYAKHPGSVAAPTAGLHFTPSLLKQLEGQGHTLAHVTLHVSLGTFLGVKTQDLSQHQMHEEQWEINANNLKKIMQARTKKQPVLAVGTTAVRVLETLTETNLKKPKNLKGQTKIFLYPPAKFKHTDALITNFHLPHSTLLMLVAAFTSAPNTPEKFTSWQKSRLGQAYQAAIAQNYRFFSFGDAMLIL